MTLATDKDFGDWLNPFLVKELRQTLRSHVFVICMLWVQASMTLITGLRLASTSPWADIYYWVSIVFMLHLVLPFRHAPGGDPDLKPENYELLAVTPRSNERTMNSKWLSTMSLMLLLVSSLLPYQLIRYYAGGVDIVAECVALAVIVLNGAVYSLWAIFVSTFAPIARAVLLLMLLPGVLFCDSLAISAVMSSGTRADTWVSFGALYLVISICSIGFTSSRFDFDFTRAGELRAAG